MSLSSSDVLFVGRGVGVVSYYRTGSPAFNLGCDWIACAGRPNDPNEPLTVAAALKRGGITMPDFTDYKIVVVQQASGQGWLNEIIRLKRAGVVVLYEIDDYLHYIHKVKHHKGAKYFTKKRLAEYEICMRASSGLICSTDWLAKTYGKFNKNVYVCRNAIEGRRYDYLNVPERDTVNIGWAGGEGHVEATRAWMAPLGNILNEFKDARFISMGLPVGEFIADYFPDQVVSLPWCGIENFPGAMTNFDFCLGPADRNNFYAAKSDLRFLETGAIGIPLIGDPFVYSEIIHKETGYRAENPVEAEEGMRFLLEHPDVAEEISYNVRDYVLTNRTMEGKGATQWEEVFKSVV